VCGLGLATVLVLITLSASELSMRLLMVASQMAGKRTYEDLAAHCFGRAGRSTVDLSITIMNLGSLVAYLNILADMFSLVANTVIPPGAEPSRNMLLAGEWHVFFL
jgi:amino acid permease